MRHALMLGCLAAATLLAVAIRSAVARPCSDAPPITLVLESGGERLTGRAEAWDFQSVTLALTNPRDGVTSRTLTWCEVRADAALAALQKLIDRDRAHDWLSAGLALLACDRERESDRAFANAARLDKQLLSIIDTARAYHAQGRDVWEALPKPPPSTEPLPPGPPRTPRTPRNPPPDTTRAEHGHRPWPTPTDDERRAHLEQLKKNCEQMIAKAGVRLRMTESDHFVIYSDLPPADASARVKELEKMNDILLETFNLPRGTNVFHGKCAVFIFEHREDFLTFETAAFGIDARRAGGLFHPLGPFAYTSFFRGTPGSDQYRSTLVHETVHAFMYRYKSPAELPTWLNEGLADAIAAEIVPENGEGPRHWNHARQFAMQNKRAMDVMNQTYEAGTWFNDDSYPISHMLVRLMIRANPGGFKQWINDIKDGKDWRASLKERMNTSIEELSDRFNAAIRTEKRYTKIRE